MLAKALQHCAEQSGAAPSAMCGTVPRPVKMPCALIQLEEEDIWEASLPEYVEDEPMASLTT